MAIQFIGGPFDGAEHLGDPSEFIVKPISEVHIGIAGGKTAIKSVSELDAIVSQPIKLFSLYALETRQRVMAFYHQIDLTLDEFSAIANSPVRTWLQLVRQLRRSSPSSDS